MMKLKKNMNLRKKKTILDESSKFRLISQTYNPWNPRSRLNRETQFPINLMLKDEIKKYQFLNFSKQKEIVIKKDDQFFF